MSQKNLNSQSFSKMESSANPNPGSKAEDDCFFFDAADDFPFHDCLSNGSDPSSSSSSSSPEIRSPAASLRRRRSVSSKESNCYEPYVTNDSKRSPVRMRNELHRDSKGKEKGSDAAESSRVEKGQNLDAFESDRVEKGNNLDATESGRVEKGKDLDAMDSDQVKKEKDLDTTESVRVEKDKDLDTIESNQAEEDKHLDAIESGRVEKEKDLDETESGRIGKGTDFDTAESSRASTNPSRATGEETEVSTVTTAINGGRVCASVDSVVQLRQPSPATDSSLLTILAGLVIKAVGFQFNLLISLITFPPWAFYCCCVFILDPFGTMRRGRNYLISKVTNLWNLFCGSLNPFLLECLKDEKLMLKVVYQFGWGLFWATYVCVVLFSLLVSALLLSGLMMRVVVEEPIVIKENLSFDYTKNTPEAYVPIISCAGVDCDASCKENIEAAKILGYRFIPQRHKVQVTVSLTLPESEYNRNLGMFQVRVDFLASNGRILDSSKRPCMLKFRSEPIRLVQTLLKIAPLVTGYVSETQTLNLKFRGFVERDIPTACLKVTIEQRAEFRPGAHVPELYDASLVLESELPFFRRIIWYWKKTLFVWVAMTFFIVELLLALVCCRPLIIPRTRQRHQRSSTDPPYRNGWETRR